MKAVQVATYQEHKAPHDVYAVHYNLLQRKGGAGHHVTCII